MDEVSESTNAAGVEKGRTNQTCMSYHLATKTAGVEKGREPQTNSEHAILVSPDSAVITREAFVRLKLAETTPATPMRLEHLN